MEILSAGLLGLFVGFGLGLYIGQRGLEGVKKDLDNARNELDKAKAKVNAKKKS